MPFSYVFRGGAVRFSFSLGALGFLYCSWLFFFFFFGFALWVINSYLSKKKQYNLLLNFFFFLYLWRLRDFINLIYISI